MRLDFRSTNTVSQSNNSRLLGLPIALLLWVGLIVPVVAIANDSPSFSVPDIRLNASSYVLLENQTGTIVKEYQADVQIAPASLTKLMTAYLLAHKIVTGVFDYTTTTVISANAWRLPGSTMFLEAGDEVTVEQLMLGLVVQSGNDAAVAIAELVAGDVQSFVIQMNQAAQQLGMRNTTYKNPNGLPVGGQVTTARDTAILARSLIRNFPSVYQRFYSVKDFRYRGINQLNRNRLLWLDDQFDGVKTGHTDDSGYHIVVSAKQNDIRYTGVILGTQSDKQRIADARKLISWGFRYFDRYEIYQPFQPLGKAKVWMGKTEQVAVGVTNPVIMVLSRERSHQIGAKLLLVQYARAPIVAGDDMGKLVIDLNDTELMSVPLIALAEVPRGGFFQRVLDWCKLQLLRFNE